MSLKIRLSRAGAKKRPFYRIVVADSRFPRDGRFIEIVGTYEPILPKDHEKRTVLNAERIQHWLKVGAQPTDRVLRFLDAAGLAKRTPRNNPQKASRARRRRSVPPAAAAADGEAAPAEAPAAADESSPARHQRRPRGSGWRSGARRVIVARIGAAHGIKGEVRVKSFTAAPLDIAAYGPLEAADGRRFTVGSARPVGASPDMLVVRFREVADRNAAEALTGLELSRCRASGCRRRRRTSSTMPT